MVMVAVRPWEDLAGLIVEALAPEPAGVNVYPTPTSKMATPAIVVNPADPWVTRDGGGFDFVVEHYLALCLVNPSDPASGTRLLYRMGWIVLEAVPGGGAWTFDDMSAPRLYEHEGITAMGLAVSLSLKRPIP